MQNRARRLAPVVGGATALATAVGAFAPAPQVAMAAPDVAEGASSPLGLAQDGTFESCSAYFGLTKSSDLENGLGAVAFDVTDAEGDDPGGHSVPGDVDVVLVLELDNGDETTTLRCIPEEITEADWDTWVDALGTAGFLMPPWPGPGHFGYPLPSSWFTIDGHGVVTSVSFEVTGLPADHELISPQGLHPLDDPFEWLTEFYESVGEVDFSPDARIVEIIQAEAGPDAVEAYQDALAECAAHDDPMGEDGPGPTFPLEGDLGEAFKAVISGYGGIPWEEVEALGIEDLGCSALTSLPFSVGMIDGVASIPTYTEAIVLAGPVQPTTTTTTAPGAPAGGAQPVVAAPTYTG